MSAASLAQRGFALLNAGDVDKAVPLLTRAAREGDRDAQLKVAWWRLWGLNGSRDFETAHRLLASAAAKGSAKAKTQRAILFANGTGVEPDWGKAVALLREAASDDRDAAAQLRLIESMNLGPDGAPAAPPRARRTLSDRPRVDLIEGFLTPAECAWLIKAAAPTIGPSLVIDSATGRTTANPVRTSAGMNFGPPIEDLVVRAINARIAAASKSHVSWGEPLHVLRYLPGEEYRPHFDANGRVATVLVWLNDDYRGGETLFTETGLKVRGRAGDALYFENMIAGRLDPLSRHAGLPVTAGEKWLASRWIQPGPHSPWE